MFRSLFCGRANAFPLSSQFKTFLLSRCITSDYKQTIIIDGLNEDNRMKKWAVLISAVGLAFAVSGCSSDYVMATKAGRMILTDGKPEIDDDTGLVSYHDQQGNAMQINRDDVSQIIER